jgi:hypothetical protein
MKLSGICCVTITGGVVAGKRESTTRMASTPPVDAPIAINFLADCAVDFALCDNTVGAAASERLEDKRGLELAAVFTF